MYALRAVCMFTRFKFSNISLDWVKNSRNFFKTIKLSLELDRTSHFFFFWVTQSIRVRQFRSISQYSKENILMMSNKLKKEIYFSLNESIITLSYSNSFNDKPRVKNIFSLDKKNLIVFYFNVDKNWNLVKNKFSFENTSVPSVKCTHTF